MKHLSIEETAAILGLTPQAIRQRIARGQLPHRRWGRRVLVPKAELERLLGALPGRSADEAMSAVEERQ
jgi:excisionase family DNA binding protein